MAHSSNHKDIAIQYLEHFCKGETEALAALIHDDFSFSGPFISFDSKEGYIASLMEDPPRNYSIEILNAFAEGDDVALFYNFSKPGISTPMAQVFKFNNDKICASLLIFDTRVFQKQ